MPLTFHLFPSLPAELRRYIWYLSLLHDRVIKLSCDRGIYPNLRRYARYFRASCANPPQLRVNCEARYEALQLYSPYFRTAHAPHSCIYLAPERDVVHLPEAVLAYLGAVERAVLQQLIIDVQDYMFFGSYWMDSLRSMEQLKELVLVVWPLTSSPHRMTGQMLTGDEVVVAMLKDAFVECARTSPEWTVPRVKVVSHAGTTMGDITVEADDIDTGDYD
ncbi:hypothetical protein BDV29DRAFT_94524 [Aspergillus leporis]|jgi:hypothetical protein|uniref:2EXR domain-containing protein n=1 Tax=Aspergillus leporis TaxID=41062 RepID=A0A5N5WGD0_9EURO|nr:hypothetical protein BDV29DRAFT_94524 [Aspergillus leporis]